MPGFDPTVAVRIDMVTPSPLQIPELLPHPFAGRRDLIDSDSGSYDGIPAATSCTRERLPRTT